jgi:hypothetical protein
MSLEAWSGTGGEHFRVPVSVMDGGVKETNRGIASLECRVLPIPGFNATTYEISTGDGDSRRTMRVLLYRRPAEGVVSEKEPDYNRLEASIVEGELTPDLKVINQAVIWNSEDLVGSSQPGLCNIEDLRAGDHGLCGLTAVMKKISPTESAEYIPYPGVVRLPDSLASAEAFGKLPEITILEKLGPGKDLAPIGKDDEGKVTFLFRSQGEENSHKLKIVEYNEETRGAEVVGELVFPKSSWSQWKMGTAAGLFWLDEKRAILPIHGINNEQTLPKGEGPYNYSLGVALIEKDDNGHLQVVKVADKPLIVPSQLDSLGINQRFPGFRSIVYSCGAWLDEKKDKNAEDLMLNLLVNVGDKATVLVKTPWSEVISSLISPEKNQLAN